MAKDLPIEKVEVAGGLVSVTIPAVSANNKSIYVNRVSGSTDTDADFIIKDSNNNIILDANVTGGMVINAVFNARREVDKTAPGTDLIVQLSNSTSLGKLQVSAYYYD